MNDPGASIDRLATAMAQAQDRGRAELPKVAAADVLAALDEPPIRHRRWVWPLGAATAASLCAALVLLFVRGVDDTPAFRVGPTGQAGSLGTFIAAPAHEALPIELGDGSTLSLQPRGRMRVERADPEATVVVLESGAAQVDVPEGVEHPLRVDAGPFVVSIPRGVATIRWAPVDEAFQLDLREGAVTVQGPTSEDTRTLSAPQSLVVRLGAPSTKTQESVDAVVPALEPGDAIATTRARDEQMPTTAPRAESRARNDEATPRPATGPAAAPPTPAWRELAAEGRYRDALAEAQRLGFDDLVDRLSADDLLRLADTARFARRSGAAQKPLMAVRRRFPDAPQAATAAYTLGRIAFDLARDYDRAAHWFSTYLDERRDGPLAREALGRLMESQQRAGRTATARQTARTYLRRHPEGPHADLARRLGVQ
jgi:TolA-binding protein